MRKQCVPGASPFFARAGDEARFQSAFLDFKVDLWISKWISGFQSGFLDFKRISGFHLNRYYSEDTAKIYS